MRDGGGIGGPALDESSGLAEDLAGQGDAVVVVVNHSLVAIITHVAMGTLSQSNRVLTGADI